VLKLLLVVAVVALLVYAVMWAMEKQRATGKGRHPSSGRPTRKQPPRQVAPDDDEDFLRDLDRKRRQDDA
jgi:hypothetical protein